ncbi:MAG: transporter permease [Nocardioides sp.]|nr:transporter permease [Nocardioides sp.]
MTAAVIEETPLPSGTSRRWVQRLWKNRNGKTGLVVLFVLVVAALAAAFGLLPYDPLEAHQKDALTGPSAEYLFGTDQFGRDVLSRLATGVLASLRIALLSVLMATLVGGLAGVAAGFFGGWVDRVAGRLADVVFAFPAILLALAIITALGRGWLITSVAIAVVYTPIFFRVARGPVLSVREADFVKAGRVLGYGSLRLLLKHVLPNVAAPIIIQIALALSWAILTESTLSFLGLGTQPPDPSLGLMVNEGRTLFTQAWWLLVMPSSAIVLAVVGLNLLGDGVRDVLDPRRRG